MQKPVVTDPGGRSLTPVRNEPWRQRTTSRYLERLKRELVILEDSLEGVQSVQGGLPATKGFWASLVELGTALGGATLQDQIDSLKTKIENVYAGHTHAEIANLGVEIQHLKLDREKLAARLAALPMPGDFFFASKRYQAQMNRDEVTAQIQTIDKQIIELEADLRELHTLDSFKLSKELGLDPSVGSALRVSTDQLTDIKTKVDTIESIRPKPAPVPPPPAPPPPARKTRAELKARVQGRIARLKREKEAARQEILQARTRDQLADDELDELLRSDNMYDDALRKAEEELKKYL